MSKHFLASAGCLAVTAIIAATTSLTYLYPTRTAVAAGAAESAASTVLPAAGSKDPLDITAQDSLEWYRDKGLYVARGNARATRGDMTIEADVLTARESAADKNNASSEKSSVNGGVSGGTKAERHGKIDLLTASGNVKITSRDRIITGEYGTYDLVTGSAVLKGNNLRYASSAGTVTARDALEYHDKEGVAVARGKAVAEGKERRLEADILTAQLARMPDGNTEMTRMAARGNVVITTNKDVVRGNQAAWDFKQNTAVVTGNVKVAREGTRLSGDRAEVDMKHGQSTMSGIGTGKRASAVLVDVKNKQRDGASTKKND